jgi:hypothetical protein
VNEVEIHRVTDDPQQNRELLARYYELDTFTFAEYAHGLGLYPPGYEEGQRHSVSIYYPPDADPNSDGILIWDTSSVGEVSEIADDELEDDGPNPWDTAAPPGWT